MPRVEVLSEIPGREDEVLLVEQAPSKKLVTEHYAEELVARMGWALVDAEQREQAHPE
jgi:hypothetical protein